MEIIMNEKTLTDDLALFKVRATNIMADFFIKWQSSFVYDKVYFDEAQIQPTSLKERIYTLSVKVVDENRFKETKVVVTGNLDDDDELSHRYTTTLTVNGDKIHGFKRVDFDPYSLGSDFKKFYATFFNYNVLDNRYNRFFLTFDEQANISNIRIFFDASKDNNTFTIDRLIYNYEDIIILSRYNLLNSGFSSYCNFKFLWYCTNIRNVINEQNLIDAYQEYIKNMDSYHILLKMGKI
jgi:hypothetical protein